VIKHDIAELNNDIGNLQRFVKQQKSSRGKGNKEADEHSDNVVVLLQSKLANTSMGFKDVLEIRTQVTVCSLNSINILEYEGFQRPVRTVHRWSHSICNAATKYCQRFYWVNLTLALSASSPLYNPIQRPHSAQSYKPSSNGRSDVLKLNMDREEATIGTPQFQQMQLVEQQDQYLSQRGQAIESIESTIHELGSIFQQLAQMVSEQADTVQRYRPSLGLSCWITLIKGLMPTRTIL